MSAVKSVLVVLLVLGASGLDNSIRKKGKLLRPVHEGVTRQLNENVIATVQPVVQDANVRKWKPPTDEEIYEALVNSMIEYNKYQWKKPFLQLSSSFASYDKPEKCYDGVGCFSNDGGFAHLEPKLPELVQTKFLFFRGPPKEKSFAPKLSALFSSVTAEESLSRDTFDPTATTYVVVHGFMSACDSQTWTYTMADRLLRETNKCNVICVDWRDGANPSLFDYWQAAANTRIVGKQVANLLQMLQKEKNLQLNKVHVIGHSLGAHVAGYVGKDLPGIGRITGLDPAGPMFIDLSKDARLDRTDADFVDVIHTNAKVKHESFWAFVWDGGFGTTEVLGDVDFYPNGGEDQAGCPGLISGVFSKAGPSCSHTRAALYFVESITSPCKFMASPCTSYQNFFSAKEQCFDCTRDTCAPMGYHSLESKARGSLYLNTETTDPFCGYHYLVTVTVDKDQKPTNGKLTMTLSAGNYTTAQFEMTVADDWQKINGGDRLQKVVVIPPIPLEPHRVEMTYTVVDHWWSYSWLVYKTDTLKIGDISITERFGKKLYVCPTVTLDTGKMMQLPVTHQQCEQN